MNHPASIGNVDPGFRLQNQVVTLGRLLAMDRNPIARASEHVGRFAGNDPGPAIAAHPPPGPESNRIGLRGIIPALPMLPKE